MKNILYIALAASLFLVIQTGSDKNKHNSTDRVEHQIHKEFPKGFRFPPRKDNALTGSAWTKIVSNMTAEERDAAAYQEIAEGNIPDSFRHPVYFTCYLKDARGQEHKVRLSVLPDFLAIGSDSDFIRIPLLAPTAQKIADLYGATLPTPKLSDLIHFYSLLKLVPHPMTPDSTMTTVPVFARHDSIIEVARHKAQNTFPTLTAGHKKDIVLTNRMSQEPDRLFIYGWHYPDGSPIQPLSAAHGIGYVDYSHGVRLIQDEVLVDGQCHSLSSLLQDSVYYKLFSYEAKSLSITKYKL